MLEAIFIPDCKLAWRSESSWMRCCCKISVSCCHLVLIALTALGIYRCNAARTSLYPGESKFLNLAMPEWVAYIPHFSTSPHSSGAADVLSTSNSALDRLDFVSSCSQKLYITNIFISGENWSLISVNISEPSSRPSRNWLGPAHLLDCPNRSDSLVTPWCGVAINIRPYVDRIIDRWCSTLASFLEFEKAKARLTSSPPNPWHINIIGRLVAVCRVLSATNSITSRMDSS